jgi:biotin operon repressor
VAKEAPTFSSLYEENHQLFLVSGEVLATTLSISSEWVRQLGEQGVLVKVKRGKYDLIASVQGYLAYRDEQDSSDGSDEKFKDARAQLYVERVREQKRKSDLIEGRCISRPVIEEIILYVIATTRAAILAIPNRCAPQVADVSSAHECFKILEDAVREALNELYDLRNAPEESLRRYRESVSAEVPAASHPNQDEPDL